MPENTQTSADCWSVIIRRQIRLRRDTAAEIEVADPGRQTGGRCRHRLPLPRQRSQRQRNKVFCRCRIGIERFPLSQYSDLTITADIKKSSSEKRFGSPNKMRFRQRNAFLHGLNAAFSSKSPTPKRPTKSRNLCRQTAGEYSNDAFEFAQGFRVKN